MGDNSNQPSFLLTSPVTRSWRWHKQWIHQHTYEQGLWVMHIGKPIERTVASTSRPCFSLSTKQPHEVGIFNIASIFLTRFVIMDKKWKLSNTHNESIHIVSACEWQPGSSLLSVVSSTSNCVINIYDGKISLLTACKGRGPHLLSYPSGNLKVV